MVDWDDFSNRNEKPAKKRDGEGNRGRKKDAWERKREGEMAFEDCRRVIEATAPLLRLLES